MSKKLTYEFVKKYMENFKYSLISKEYKGAHKKLKYICPNNHKGTISYGNFQQGKRCSECAKKIYGNYHKHSIEYVKKYIEDFGEKLLSKEYKNSYGKLEIKCKKKNHIYWISYSNFRKGYRCSICSAINFSGKNNPAWKGGVKKKNIPLYNTYAYQLDWIEKVRRDPKNSNYLQIRCTNSNCKKWFIPTIQEVCHRRNSINGTGNGENRFYCSEKCKNNCSLYQQKKYPKGFKIYNNRSSQKEWADLVKERDNNICQRCGCKEDIIAHHFEGLNVNPLMSADIDMGVTLCKKCDKLAHSDIGCRPIDLQRGGLGCL